MKENRATLARYINNAMRPYRIAFPVLLSLCAGGLVGVSTFILRSNSDYHLIRAISSHLSTLVEESDRPEMIRVLNSIATERGVSLLIVNDDSILASTRNTSELDTPYVMPKILFDFGYTKITTRELMNTVSIRREGGPHLNAEVVILSPLVPILDSCMIVAGLILILSLLASKIYADRVNKTIRRAMKPVEKLDELVRGLLRLDEDRKFEPTGIIELDDIQSTIFETKRALIDATERLAQIRAKELLAESYKMSIHNLYPPVAALKETAILLEGNPTGEELKKINDRIVRLAQQILNQLNAANETLGSDSQMFDQSDVRQCISEAVEQSVIAYPKRDSVEFRQKIPNVPVIIPHDPTALRSAIANLMSNALRACKEIVEVELEQNGTNIAIRVSDDGLGIKKDDVGLLIQGRILSQNANRPAYGLPSVNHVARCHGGRLIYKQSAYGGACFEVRI